MECNLFPGWNSPLTWNGQMMKVYPFGQSPPKTNRVRTSMSKSWFPQTRKTDFGNQRCPNQGFLRWKGKKWFQDSISIQSGANAFSVRAVRANQPCCLSVQLRADYTTICCLRPNWRIRQTLSVWLFDRSWVCWLANFVPLSVGTISNYFKLTVTR